MSGSNDFASPATLMRSGTGPDVCGWNSNRSNISEIMARKAVSSDDEGDFFMAFILVRKNDINISKGAVRCCISARTAKRISRISSEYQSEYKIRSV